MSIDTGQSLVYDPNYPTAGVNQSSQQFRDNYAVIKVAIENLQVATEAPGSIISLQSGVESDGSIKVLLGWLDNALLLPTGDPSQPSAGMIRYANNRLEVYDGTAWNPVVTGTPGIEVLSDGMPLGDGGPIKTLDLRGFRVTRNGDIAVIESFALDDLRDVQIDLLEVNQGIFWDGTNWVNKYSIDTFSALELLEKIKTVDGIGSGLDADFLRGMAPTPNADASTVVSRDPSGRFAGNVIVALDHFVGNVIGDLDGNARTASAWKTPRTVTFTGDVLAEFTLDGTSNVTVNATIPLDILNKGVMVNATGDGLTSSKDPLTGITSITIQSSSGPQPNTVVYRDETGSFSAVNITAENFYGTLTGTFIGNVQGNADTATKLQTGRQIELQGDATGSTMFDGSANAQIPVTLATTGVVAGTYGNNVTVSQVTVDDKGRVISAIDVPIDGAALAGGTHEALPNTLVKRNDEASFYANVVTANYFAGVAEYSEKWFQQRDITLEGGVTGTASIDGSANVVIVTALDPNVVVKDENGDFEANIITATLNGNAATADRWSTTRQFSLTGLITGNAAIDGSEDIVIDTGSELGALAGRLPDIFYGDGVKTEFILGEMVPDASAILAIVGGVIQTPEESYTVEEGTRLVFSEPPFDGEKIVVRYFEIFLTPMTEINGGTF